MVKVAHRFTEQARVSVRNVRRDGMDHVKKDGDLSKDEQHAWSAEIQELTDGFIKKIDVLLSDKEKEIRQI